MLDTVKLIADRYDIPMTWLEVDDFWAMKPAASDAKWDEPIMLHFEAMQDAALGSANERGVRVILTGEGGDEISMPGNMLHIQDWLRQFHLWSIWRDLQIATPQYRRIALEALRHSSVPRWLRRLTRRPGVNIPVWVRDDFGYHICIS